MPCIQIRDPQGGYLSFDLREILANLNSIGPTLKWYILTLEVQSHPNSGFSVLELEKEISKSPNGKLMTWKQLCELASQLVQTLNCVIVGISPETEPPSLPLEETYRGDRIIIAAFDSSHWTVCVPTQDLTQKLQAAFRDTRLVEHVDID
jgi:hypothetical protein